MINRMKRNREAGGVRHVASLRPDVEKALLAYICGALSGGVSLLALSTLAEAEVIYTPAHTPIPMNGGMVPLDLNNDGISDFAFWNLGMETSVFYNATFLSLYVGCFSKNGDCQVAKNQIWGKGHTWERFASALQPRFHVHPGSSYFQPSPRGKNFLKNPVALMARLRKSDTYQGYLAASSTSGQWLYTQHRYLGLQFVINGELHYGWARVAVTLENKSEIKAELTGYAYETMANKPIVTGNTGMRPTISEVSTLGRLAQGASGISSWRK